MSLIVAIILGAIIGYIASKVMGEDHGFMMNLVIGVVGSFIGSILSSMLTGSDRAFLAFSWMGLVWSLVGALILLAIVNAIQGRRHHHVAS